MKILLVNSSYRLNGNTSHVLNLLEEKLRILAEKNNYPLEIENISLSHSDIQLCRGCRVCFDKGENRCPLKDNLLAIRDKMLNADGYIIASPVYVEDINGIMKNWIDRMAFNCHRPAFFGKSVFLLTTSGIGSSNHSIKTMGTALNTWALHIEGKMKFRLGALSDEIKIRSQYEKKIAAGAQKFLHSLIARSAEKPTLYSLMAFTVQQ